MMARGVFVGVVSSGRVVFSLLGDSELKFAHSSATALEFPVARYRNQPLYLKVDNYKASLVLDLHLNPCVLGLNKKPIEETTRYIVQVPWSWLKTSSATREP